MKHIKICKPKLFSKKKAIRSSSPEVKLADGLKTNIPTTEGLGCIPTGNIVDRD
jgi:hypothetical protein